LKDSTLAPRVIPALMAEMALESPMSVTTLWKESSMKFKIYSALATVIAVAVAGILSLVLSGCAPELPGDESAEDAAQDDDALLDGAPVDPSHRFAVGLCRAAELLPDGSCPRSGTPGTGRCSATLVGPNLVLTARHCVQAIAQHPDGLCASGWAPSTYDPAILHVTPSLSVYDAGARWYNVDTIITPEGNNACVDDIAFLVLEERVRGIRPAFVDAFRDVTQSPPDAIAIVGRGVADIVYDPVTFVRTVLDDGGLKRRIAENIPFLCAATSTEGCPVGDFDYPEGNFGHARSTASGDSGCGIYDQALFDLGIYAVIGVGNTGVVDLVTGQVNGGGAVRLDWHRNTVFKAYVEAWKSLH
jgi:hypothetical protein